MRSPFPGMDPYLERYTGDVHLCLIVYGSEQLQPQLAPALVSRIDDLDDEVDSTPSRFLKIVSRADPERAITLIDFLRPGRPRVGQVVGGPTSGVSTVEIDLFAAGLAATVGLRTRYAARIECSDRPGHVSAYPMSVRRSLSRLPIPLRPGEPVVVLELQSLVERAYAGGAYGDPVDYAVPPASPLPPDDAAWVDALLRDAGKRP